MTLAERTLKCYELLVLRRPWLCLSVVALVLAAAVSQLPKIRIDASADSLMLQGDPSLELFREVSAEYKSEEFLIITWQPREPLLSPGSLIPLGRLADELRGLDGVASVVTVLDVPLLESPPVKLSEITSGAALPSLRQPEIDRNLVLREFVSSPIYADLLVSRDASLTAVQINLQRDEAYYQLLSERDQLRKRRQLEGLSAAQQKRLESVEVQFKANTASSLEARSVLVRRVRQVAAGYGSSAEIFVGGVPMIAVDMVTFVLNDVVTFGAAILGIMLLILAVIFRSLRWVVIPLVTSATTVLLMLGLLGAIDWRMTVISSNFVAVLLIVALSIAIHLIVRYRELHALDSAQDDYLRVLRTVQLMFVPCFYTGITTVVAFVSLVVSGIQPVIDFGWMMTAGIAVALLVSFMLVPCLILVWPAAAKTGHRGADPTLIAYFASVTDRFGGTILATSAILAIAIGIGVSRLQVENRFIDYFDQSTEIYKGMELLDAKLGGTIPLDIILTPPANDEPLPGLGTPVSADETPTLDDDDPFAEEIDESFAEPSDSFGEAAGGYQPSYWFSQAGMRDLDRIHNYIDSLPQTGKVLSLSTVFSIVKNLLGDDIGGVELALLQKSLPDEIRALMVDPYFSADKQQARITVRVKETSRDLRRDEFLTQLRQHITGELGFAPAQVQFTGMLVLYNNVLQSLFRSQILTLGAVFGTILVMFLLLFRSLSLALITLAPNLLAAGLVLGIMGLFGIPLDIMTITIAAIVVGIGVDNCIHYVHRYRREFAVDGDYRAAMYRSHGSIGRAMYYTTLTVVVGFSLLVLSNFKPSIYFGMLTVLAMIAAVLGALLLLPRLILVIRPLGPGRSDANAGSAAPVPES